MVVELSHRGYVVVVAEPGLRGRGRPTAGLCCVEPSVCSRYMVAGSWSSNQGCVVVVAEPRGFVVSSRAFVHAPWLRGHGHRTVRFVVPDRVFIRDLNCKACCAEPSSWTLNRRWPCDFGLDGPGEIRVAWLGQSGAGDALPVLTEEEFRDLNGLFVPENAEHRPGPS
ncbi:unnamed protein product [Arabidopsis thaliana]|uniref:Uncharacterized protein n=1 Tax=Arabidopsis thaliana TaxID=3702 RepID=A0A5S9XHD9_ARATH|nr:unnamed protein product [Arabidopsis thaliana]